MKNENLTNHTKPFIPTMAEWVLFYNAWRERLEKSLSKCGSKFACASACEEAVQEAFIKVLGLSDHLRLSEPLVPRTEGLWYAFLYYQAKGRLSCHIARAKRFVSLPEWNLAEETGDAENWGDPEGVSEPTVNDRAWAGDRSWFRAEFRKVLVDLCRSAGVKDYNLRAFVRFVLDELEGEGVVAEIPEVLNSNNLYQVKKRITELLIKNKERFADLHRDLLAA